jgi:5-methylcytosine-specific restriction endonuclease McrA
VWRWCAKCSTVVPANEYVAHVNVHRERNGSTYAWRKLRQVVLARDGYACTVCGKSGRLEVDHVNGDWRDDRLENLRTVCFEHNPRGPRAA